MLKENFHSTLDHLDYLQADNYMCDLLMPYHFSLTIHATILTGLKL